MEDPTIFEPYEAGPDVVVLPSYFPIPGMGILPVNAFVLKAGEPVLVDTGLVPLSDRFMKNLSSVIDPADLRWLWLTHTDQDHIGSLHRILEAAPQSRVVTSFLGVGKMSLFQPLAMDRVFLLNPGQSFDAGDRKLTAFRPPTYDAPETTGFFDPKASILFSADSFGALLEEPSESAAEVGEEALREGMVTWATVDAPWMHTTERKSFEKALDDIRALSPETVLSSHLPAAPGMTEDLLDILAGAPSAKPFVGPDQKALEATVRGDT
jgi:flavorubredoxin